MAHCPSRSRTRNLASQAEAALRFEFVRSARGGVASLPDVISDNAAFHPYEVVLEPDRIRLVPPDEGFRLWRSWWEERRRKE